jgi:hypothetical protein
MPLQIEATREFAGPWWLAVAVLELQSWDVVAPAFSELASIEIGPVRRAGTTGWLALHWPSRAHPSQTRTGELRIVEVTGDCTELTLSGELAGPVVAGTTFDDVAERLARRIEAAVAREIGTQ